MTDFLLLTKKEVRDAREVNDRPICLFPDYRENSIVCQAELKVSGLCRLCKVLTEFAEGEGDE